VVQQQPRQPTALRDVSQKKRREKPIEESTPVGTGKTGQQQADPTSSTMKAA
jgi:hypothetical protein